MLGLCCHYLVDEGNGKVANMLRLRNLQFGRWQQGEYSLKRVRDTYIENVINFRTNIRIAFNAGFKLIRFPSGFFPLFDQVPDHLHKHEVILSNLHALGNLVKARCARVTFHPGQFCSLSSDDPQVVSNSIREIEHHAWIFDAMGLPASPQFCINVHGGKRGRASNLCRAIDRLAQSARSRLTLENDELCYSLEQLVPVHQATGVPLMLDTHHHSLNPGQLSFEHAHDLACSTWPTGVVPLQHISSPLPGTDGLSITVRRKHHTFITSVPERQLRALRDREIGVMVEAKMKNFAVKRMSEQFDVPIW